MPIETELDELDVLHDLIKIRLKTDRGGDSLRRRSGNTPTSSTVPLRSEVPAEP